MNEQVLSRFEFEKEFKEKLVELVLYKNVSAEQTARKYGLPNTTILINRINNYKRKLEKGAVTLVPMEKPGKKDVTALKKWHLHDTDQENLAVDMVRLVRGELPWLGGHKLYKCLYTPFRSNGINIGRDKLYKALKKHRLLIDRKKKRAPGTKNANHSYLKYSNLIKELAPTRSNELWVSDITYISAGYDFNYLSLITDAYSRKIMGYYLHPQLTAKGAIKALQMTLKEKPAPNTLIHHSDRGVQYCSFDYIVKLKKAGVKISMTENGEAYENSIAERINGILKTEFKLKRVFSSRSEALLEVTKSI